MPLLSLRRPKPALIDPSIPVNYAPSDLVDLEILPAGYRRHRLKARIGTGEEWYQRARAALLAGTMFDLSWVSIEGDAGPFETGHSLTVVSRIWPLWITSPLRVLDIVDTHDRCDVTIGALVGHPVSGQERFSVAHHSTNGAVTFEIDTVSRPVSVMRLMAPALRIVQARFRRNAADSMAAASRPPR